VRLCRERATGNIFAMKKLRKDEMLRRGQVGARSSRGASVWTAIVALHEHPRVL
jgi:hypothetical protein